MTSHDPPGECAGRGGGTALLRARDHFVGHHQVPPSQPQAGGRGRWEWPGGGPAAVREHDESGASHLDTSTPEEL